MKELLTARTCGPCQACCFSLQITSEAPKLAKRAWKKCKHQGPKGCRVYTRSGLEQAAVEFVRARIHRDRLKVERSSFTCEVESTGTWQEPGEPACWRMVYEGQLEIDPDTVCEPCMKRIDAHQRYEDASKEATRTWRALRKAVGE